jgi:hypothetical protein
MMKTTAPSFSKAKCCGNCEHRSKYQCGGDMWGYDEGDYLCHSHTKRCIDSSDKCTTRKLRVELTDTCDDFKQRIKDESNV